MIPDFKLSLKLHKFGDEVEEHVLLCMVRGFRNILGEAHAFPYRQDTDSLVSAGVP